MQQEFVDIKATVSFHNRFNRVLVQLVHMLLSELQATDINHLNI